MKLIDNIKKSKFLRLGKIETTGSCAVVGNSGCLLQNEYGRI